MLENGPEVPSVWVGTSCSAVLSHPFPEEDEAVEEHAGLTSPGAARQSISARVTDLLRCSGLVERPGGFFDGF